MLSALTVDGLAPRRDIVPSTTWADTRPTADARFRPIQCTFVLQSHDFKMPVQNSLKNNENQRKTYQSKAATGWPSPFTSTVQERGNGDLEIHEHAAVDLVVAGSSPVTHPCPCETDESSPDATSCKGCGLRPGSFPSHSERSLSTRRRESHESQRMRKQWQPIAPSGPSARRGALRQTDARQLLDKCCSRRRCTRSAGDIIGP
jgi:hypothetical protein